MSNFVNYQIALIATNATLIDQINKLVIGSAAVGAVVSETTAKKPATTATEAATSTPKETSAPASAVDIRDVKAAVSAAKKANGEDFVNYALEQAGVDIEDKLLNTVKGIDPAIYDQCIGNVGSEDMLAKFNDSLVQSDDLDDDDLGDDLDDAPEHLTEIDVEAVTTAVRAAVKSGQRSEMAELLKANGASGKISGLKDCSQAQLAKILAAAA